MVAEQDVQSLMRCVTEFYPNYGKRHFGAKLATVILGKSFPGVPISKLCEMIGNFAGARPDDKKPPWDSIVAKLVAQRILTPPGMRNEAMRIKESAEEAEWQKRNAQRISDLHAVPEDKWPEVCQLGADMFPMSASRRRPVPDGWEKLPYWVCSLWNAWQIVTGRRPMPEWVKRQTLAPAAAETDTEHPF